jgi:hypothetical protein
VLHVAVLTARAGLPVTVALTALMGWATVGMFGPSPRTSPSCSPPASARRARVGYSLALVLPALYAFYLSGLAAIVPSHLAPVVLVAVGGGPDDGWSLTFATHRATGESWLLVLHAADPASGRRPASRVLLGLHGNWPPTSA